MNESGKAPRARRRQKTAFASVGSFIIVLALLILPSCGKSASPSSSPSGWPEPSGSVTASSEPTDVPSSAEPFPEETFPVPSPVVPEIDWAATAAETVGGTSHENSYTDAGGVVMSVYANYPSIPIPAIDAYYAGVLEDTVYRCGKLSDEAKALRKNNALPNPYGYSEDFTVELNAGGLISIRRDITLDTGGTLPSLSVVCDTFRVQDGAMLTMDDFFTVSQEIYTERLLYSVRQYIRGNRDVLFEDAMTAAAETFPWDCFCVTLSGLSLFYPEQTIAPQPMGVIRIDVPWEVFGDIWKMP